MKGDLASRVRRTAMTSVVVAILALGLPLAVVGRVLVVSDERGEVERSAVTTAATLSIDPPTTTDALELPPVESRWRIAYYGRDGALRTGQGPPVADPLTARAAGGTVATAAATWRLALAGGEGVVAAAPVTDRARVVGVVRVAASAGSAWTRTALVWAALAIAAGGAVAIARVLAARTAARMASSLTGLRGAAAAIGDGDLARRAARTGIVEVDEVADALGATAERLQHLLGRERALGAAASHQLRTPVMRLQLAVDVARLELAQGAAPAAGLLDQAAEEAAGLAARLEELLTVSREGARGFRGSGAPVDLPAVLDALDAAHASVVAGRGRCLVVGADPHLPEVLASSSALSHALDVLVDNATAHGAGTVRVWAREAVGTVAVDVSDDGEGFTRGLSGGGLGLSLAAALVEAHGGRLVLPGGEPSSLVSVVLRPAPAAPPVPDPAQRSLRNRPRG